MEIKVFLEHVYPHSITCSVSRSGLASVPGFAGSESQVTSERAAEELQEQGHLGSASCTGGA